MDAAEKLLLVAFGWLLGLLGPAITDAIKRRRENALGRIAILSELREVSVKLALAAYGVRMHQGTVDAEFLKWLKHHLERHAVSKDVQDFIPKLNIFLALDANGLAQINAHTSAESSKGVMLQRYLVPLLDARVSALWSFDTEFQRQLLEVRTRIAMLDELIDRSRKYFDLTFTKLEDANYIIAVENLVQACTLYAQAAERIVDVIDTLPCN